MHKLKFIFCIPVLLLAETVYSQTPSSSKAAGFECEIVIDIYNGLKDWATNVPYSGGQLLMEDKKKTQGAVTVANFNNTDGEVASTKNVIGDAKSVAGIKISPAVTETASTLIGFFQRRTLSGTCRMTLPESVALESRFRRTILIKSISLRPMVTPVPTLTLGSSESLMSLPLASRSPSLSIRDMKFMVLYNGNSDYALATAVWVDIMPGSLWFANSNTPELGADLPYANKDRFKYAVNKSWISASGQRYGFGPFYSGQPQQNSSGTQPPHPLTPLLPGTQDKENGGRILFEYNIRPLGAEELVTFDCARQKKARPYEFNDFMNTLTPLIAIPFPFETGDNNETANDDGNNSSDEDQEPTEGFIYSADRPGNFMIEAASTDMSFKVNKITFREYIRLQVKSGALPPGDNLRGSRCSDRIDWHCVYYLRRSTADRRMLADNAVASASEPNRFQPFTGNGTATISVLPSSPTDAYTLMFTKGISQTDPADDQFILLNFLADGVSATRNGTSWTLVFNGLTVNVSEGATPFAENDTFLFNVFNSASKINEIGLGEFDVTSTP